MGDSDGVGRIYIDPVPPAVQEAIDRGDDVLRWMREYLESQGFEDVSGGIGANGLRIDFPDPADEAGIRAALQAWDQQPSQREQVERMIKQDARAAVQAIKNKGQANWTNQDKIILAIALEIKSLKE